jgi:uncharacterized coiled-coil protein SlyX
VCELCGYDFVRYLDRDHQQREWRAAKEKGEANKVERTQERVAELERRLAKAEEEKAALRGQVKKEKAAAEQTRRQVREMKRKDQAERERDDAKSAAAKAPVPTPPQPQIPAGGASRSKGHIWVAAVVVLLAFLGGWILTKKHLQEEALALEEIETTRAEVERLMQLASEARQVAKREKAAAERVRLLAQETENQAQAQAKA